jgi:hypothetical protein
MKYECEKHFDTPMYYNSTPEGIFSWNLNLTMPVWEVNFKNPATTQFYNTSRVEKEVSYLEIIKAKKWK